MDGVRKVPKEVARQKNEGPLELINSFRILKGRQKYDGSPKFKRGVCGHGGHAYPRIDLFGGSRGRSSQAEVEHKHQKRRDQQSGTNAPQPGAANHPLQYI